jgi:hypothetical protein
MRLLRWKDINLEGDTPHVLVRASTSKNRRTTQQPLHPELVNALRKFRPKDPLPEAPVFRSVPRADGMYRDLKKAEIPLQDAQGRRVDMHALRMTFGTYLQAQGVPLRHAMELMRHSDRKLTDKLYTDASHLPLAQAVDALPAFSLPQTQTRTQNDTHDPVAGGREQAPRVVSSECVVCVHTAQVLESVALGHEKTRGDFSTRFSEMERAKRLELSTSTLARWCSTN